MSVLSIYKPVSDSEVKALLTNNCVCDNWGNVEVKHGFNPSCCNNVLFSGNIKLGLSGKNIVDGSGVTIKSGIANAHLHNCTIGDNVSIYNVRDYIANYFIKDEVIIRNCGRISTEEVSSFGNGTNVAVLNETGSRSVKIWDRLSSHQAYIIALFRNRSAAITKIEEMTGEYVSLISSSTGTIGNNSGIINCDNIHNVRIGPYSRLDGALRLNDGSINSCREDPVFIGPGVIMDHFIICSGSVVSDSAIVDKCFIGQGCVLGKQYSAENSLFFANCSGYHGEACSVFAGPYTTSHHKSTLLIAGMFSFMNAGSGSNQSNHMYKLGPIHQGIVERGSKTASDSYLLWPAHIGSYTLVIGKHFKNPDTSSLPFSYLIESKGESVLVPGVNLSNVGTIRDAQKWPQREKRKDPAIIDQINISLLNPCTIGKMTEGKELLKRLGDESGSETDTCLYNNMKITNRSLKRGIDLYQTGINKFLGNSIIKRLEGASFRDDEELRKRLAVKSTHGVGEWIDLAGMIVPESEVDSLLDSIEAGKIQSLEVLSKEFERMHESYNEWEWTWAAARIEEETGKPLSRFTANDVIMIVERWEKSVEELDDLFYADARKEFTLSSMTGFGVDGGDEEKQLDFEQVRGTFKSNTIVNAILDHKKQKSAIGKEMIERMKKIK